ncbi:MAG: hypothetical protein IKP86_11300 [Anaerolineaceae bacterium]|nr:hypothetical protein [Anaerolineaceae bacterium]
METALTQTLISDEKLMRRMQLYDEAGGSQNRGLPAGIKARDLPSEARNEFSDAPMDFEKSAILLWEDTLRIYDHACIENRFSENYLKFCAQLEKNIKQVGSLCLTKAVLEKEGLDFPRLESMTVKELLGMVSFHLLKCHAALDGLYQDNNLLGLTYLNWEFRWFGLGNRLKATEVKIQKIRDGEIKTGSLLAQEQTFKDSPRTNGTMSQPQSLRMNSNALPFTGSIAREMLRAEAAEEKIRAEKRREEERWERDLMKAGLMAKPFTPMSRSEIISEMLKDQQSETKPEAPAETQETRQPGELTEEEARQVLIGRALEQGDPETAETIRKEGSGPFYERWLRFVDSENRRNTIAAADRAGPANSTRRKLREKRKKKK